MTTLRRQREERFTQGAISQFEKASFTDGAVGRGVVGVTIPRRRAHD